MIFMTFFCLFFFLMVWSLASAASEDTTNK